MIKFFRHIRKTLIEQNQMGKYFKYAIGEILLVVIGIMIALQVNNWNDQRIKDQKTKAIFAQIIDELIIDVRAISQINRYYVYKDSLIEAYRSTNLNKIPRESDTIIDELDLVDMIRTYGPMEIHDRGFNLLMNQADQMDPSYKPYIDELVYLYQDLKSLLDGSNEGLKNLLNDHGKYLVNNHSWYSRMDNSLTDEVLDEFEYYKFNPIYRNYVRNYNGYIWNILINARGFEDLAIKFCRKANRDFKLKKDVDKKLSFNNPPKDLIASISGKYLFRNDTLTFSQKNNQLYESTHDNTEFLYFEEKLIKLGELRYLGDSTFYRNLRHNLKLNKDGVLSIIPMNNRKAQVLKPIAND